MNHESFLIVSSATAWVDPVVMVHRAGCRSAAVDGAERNRGEWLILRAEGRSAARRISEAERRAVGAAEVDWMDCSLLSHSGLQ